MSGSQPELFGSATARKPREPMRLLELPPPPAARARLTDPPSSHVAADALEASGALHAQQVATLRAVARWRARSTKQLAEVSGLDRYMLGRRMSELVRMGYVRTQPWPKGALCWLTPLGREVVAALESGE